MSVLRRGFAVAGIVALSWILSCHRVEEPSPLVVLIAVDGASPEILDELRAQGKLPNLDGLIRSGSYGPLESLAARRRLRRKPRRGYWSPIVWASIATGKVPDKHGIVDFLLPVPGTSLAWAGKGDGPPPAELRLPEVRGEPPFELHLRLRSYPRNGPQDVAIAFNGEDLGTLEIATKWGRYAVSLPESALRPGENRLALAFTRQSRPSDNGKSKDRRELAAALASVSVTDGHGRAVVDFDPVYGRFDLLGGFHFPEAEVVEAQSTHLRAQPLWDLLGQRGYPVGVVGYWTTWPAHEVNGFLVSSRMGIRGRRQKTTSRLTWPPELEDDLRALEPNDEEVSRLAAKLYPPDCKPLPPRELRSFEGILWQDAFYHRIARKLLPEMKRGFFTVYYELLDASGHLFLPFREGAALPPGCPESVRDVAGETYVELDRRVGELVESLPERATVILVSDHGSAPAGDRGLHTPFGVFLARGPGVRRGGAPRGLNVLDVAPTVLYALGEPIPLDMDGKLAASVFTADWLEDHPARYVDADTSSAPVPSPETSGTGVSEEVLERLRSLGYLK